MVRHAEGFESSNFSYTPKGGMDDDQPSPEELETPGPQIKASLMQALEQYKEKPVVTEKKNAVKSDIKVSE